MERHHQAAIDIFLSRYCDNETTLAVLLGGSIAHGFAVPQSDIDIIIVAERKEFLRRKNDNKLAFTLFDICTYPEGYVDCKVIDTDYLDKVSASGSDPARYAFKDNRVLFSRVDDLEERLRRAAKFPVRDKERRKIRFASQLLAWKWYFCEALKKNNIYLRNLAITKIALFSSRLILNENELLYPYHKWMLMELSRAERKPADILKRIDELHTADNADAVGRFCDLVFDFIGHDPTSVDWPNHFMRDSEQNWMEHEAPIDDI